MFGLNLMRPAVVRLQLKPQPLIRPNSTREHGLQWLGQLRLLRQKPPLQPNLPLPPNHSIPNVYPQLFEQVHGGLGHNRSGRVNGGRPGCDECVKVLWRDHAANDDKDVLALVAPARCLESRPHVLTALRCVARVRGPQSRAHCASLRCARLGYPVPSGFGLALALVVSFSVIG